MPRQNQKKKNPIFLQLVPRICHYSGTEAVFKCSFRAKIYIDHHLLFLFLSSVLIFSFLSSIQKPSLHVSWKPWWHVQTLDLGSTFGNSNESPLDHYNTTSGDEIQTMDTVRDLGVITSKNLDFKEHINKITTHRRVVMGMLLRAFETRVRGPMIMLCNTFLRSKLEYCSLVWSPKEQDKQNWGHSESFYKKNCWNVRSKLSWKIEKTQHVQPRAMKG